MLSPYARLIERIVLLHPSKDGLEIELIGHCEDRCWYKQESRAQRAACS
jgi:hypothetical protein